MAVIRNDQYLHRPGAERGAITPADPLEVLLYDGSGNPLLVKTPTGETRQALGVAGYGHDGTNWRPVKVNASGQVEVQLSGTIVELLSSSVNIDRTQWYYSDPVPLSAYRSVLVEIFAHSQYLAKLQWQSADGGWKDSRVYNGGGAIDFEERHPGKTVRLAILGLGRMQPYTYSIKGVQ